MKVVHFRSNARWVLLLAWLLCANLFRHSGMAFNQGQGWPSWLWPLLAPLNEWMVYNYFHTQRNLLQHVMKSWTLNFQSSRRRLCEWILNILNLSWPFGASASLLLEVKRLQSKESSSRGVEFESCSEKPRDTSSFGFVPPYSFSSFTDASKTKKDYRQAEISLVFYANIST